MKECESFSFLQALRLMNNGKKVKSLNNNNEHYYYLSDNKIYYKPEKCEARESQLNINCLERFSIYEVPPVTIDCIYNPLFRFKDEAQTYTKTTNYNDYPLSIRKAIINNDCCFHEA